MQGYVNLKGYGEFDNNARPDGFNVGVTFVLSPKTPTQSSEKSMATKVRSRSPAPRQAWLIHYCAASMRFSFGSFGGSAMTFGSGNSTDVLAATPRQ
jgi:hypothetical protein